MELKTYITSVLNYTNYEYNKNGTMALLMKNIHGIDKFV